MLNVNFSVVTQNLLNLYTGRLDCASFCLLFCIFTSCSVTINIALIVLIVVFTINTVIASQEGIQRFTTDCLLNLYKPCLD